MTTTRHLPSLSRLAVVVLAASWLALGGCRSESESQARPDQKASAAQSTAAETPRVPASPTPPPPTPDRLSALDELAAMDPRTPVPLQPMMAWHQKQNMMEHLVAIQRIVGALAKEDWTEIQQAAKLIESSPKMAMMCNHMGSGAPGFTQLALAFHASADTIGPAAAAKDSAKVLGATSETLQVCTGCHAKYKQDVVSADAWRLRTGSAHSPSRP